MQLKNNQPCNMQFYFWKKDSNGKPVLDFVHLPGGATIELDDNIYKAITSSLTEVAVMEERVQVLDEANVGAEIKTGKEVLTIKEYYHTGETKKVNLVKEALKKGELSIVERVKIGMADIDKFLIANKVDIKDMPDEVKLALYDKLA